MRPLLLAALFGLATLSPAFAAPLGKKEKAKLKQEAAMALKYATAASKMKARAEAQMRGLAENDDSERAEKIRGDYNDQASIEYDNFAKITPLLDKLCEANDKSTWKFIAKVADKIPSSFEPEAVVLKAVETMTAPDVQKDIRKRALKFKSAKLRRAVVLHMANKKEWDVLIDAIDDKDEGVASLAAWRLIDNRVEASVVPLIDRLEKLERDKSGIWDVLQKGIGRMLGQRCSMAIEYRSLWEVVQGKGGLSAVSPPKEQTGGGEVASGVRLFGRPIDCTRVVFILDVSGSMKAIDPDQEFPKRGGEGSRVREVEGSEAAKKKNKLKTRLQRAQRELKYVISKLPANFKINIIAYSSRVKIWKAGEGDASPPLLVLNDKNRRAACKFVDNFKADGVTATDTAILRGFDIDGARCFYLLSDGFATHDGRTPVPTSEIIAVLDEYKDRHVTVHTLGFEGADRDMMEEVARHTGGKYSDIK